MPLLPIIRGMRSAIRNNEIIREDEAVLPVVSREVQYSFSVYEALRVINGHVVHLDDHLHRLAVSCRDIGLVHPFSDQDISGSLDRLIAHDGIRDASVRIFIVGGPHPLLFITYSDLLSYPGSYYEDGVRATLYHGERFMPEAKTSNLLMQYIALEKAKADGAFEALLVDRNDDILEGTRSNFYAISGNRLYTAPDEKVLSGITRISVIRAAKELGLDVVLTPPSVSGLRSYDSVFISSTSMAAMPLSHIDGAEMGRSRWPLILDIMRLVRKWE